MARHNGKYYDPDAPLCQDDYEWLSGTGQYADVSAPHDPLLCQDDFARLSARGQFIQRGLLKQMDAVLSLQEHTTQLLLIARLDASYAVLLATIETLWDQLDARLGNLCTRLQILATPSSLEQAVRVAESEVYP
jgi:hypothetical protein